MSSGYIARCGSRGEESQRGCKHKKAGVQSLYQQQLVRGKVYAVDGSGLGDELRLVALVCVQPPCPIIVAWRVRSWCGIREGQRGRSDACADRASPGGGRTECNQLATG